MDSQEPEHTLFCSEIRFVAIYALINSFLRIAAVIDSSTSSAGLGLKDDIPDGSGHDHSVETSFCWEKMYVAKICWKKNWLKLLLLFGWNGGSKILPQLYGVATACCVS